jgi:pentatricopeptide repeat protein
MEFRLLGRPGVYHRGRYVGVGAPKPQAVFAALLINANEFVATPSLVRSVWRDPPAAADSNLRVYLTSLRRLLMNLDEGAARLETVRSVGYRLTVLPGELDLDQFEYIVGKGDAALRTHNASAAADYYEQGLELWRGRLLDGVECGPALQKRVRALDERRLCVAERWAQLHINMGVPDKVLARLWALTGEHPLRERLWTCLMLALCRSGRPSEALTAYADIRSALSEQLGADPGPELQRLYQRILHGDESLAPASRPRPIRIVSTAAPGKESAP